MFNWRRLEDDLARWRKAGWVTAEGHAAIRAELAAARPLVSASGALTVLGAVLVLLAAITFVAANWAQTPRLGRLGVLCGAMVAAYAAALALKARGADVAAQAAVLLGAALFLPTIMFVGQMYHLSGPPTDALALSGAVGLTAAALFQSKPTTFYAGATLFYWSETLSIEAEAPHWPFLLVWAVVAAVAWRARWRGGFHLVAIGLVYWLLVLGFRLNHDWDPPIEAFLPALGLGLGAFALGFTGERRASLRPRFEALRAGLGASLAVYGFILASAAAMFAQLVVDEAATLPFAALAALILAGLTVTLWAAATDEAPSSLLWWSYAALAAELALIFFRTVGTLIGTAGFFAAAAALTLGFAYLAYRLSQRRRTS